MSRLLPLREIPSRARAAEAAARRRYSSRASAIAAAQYRLDVAPGCHGQPHFDPPVLGWVLTRAAASAVAAQVTHMPGGTCHHRAVWRHFEGGAL